MNFINQLIRLPQKTLFVKKLLSSPLTVLSWLAIAALLIVFPPVISRVFGQTSTTKVSIVAPANPTSSFIVGVVGGKLVTTQVNVSDLADSDGLAAFTFKVRYNPSQISVTDTDNNGVADTGSVTVGTFLGSSGKKVNCSIGYIDKDPTNTSLELLTFTCITLNLSPAAPTGSGGLATITFKTGNTVSSGTLDLVNTGLADNTSKPAAIAHTVVGATIQVAKCADTNGDGIVTSPDILYVVSKYRTSDPKADLDGSGLVTSYDISIAVAQYRKTC